jgi:hypothetical protein
VDPSTAAFAALAATALILGLVLGAVGGAYVVGCRHGRAELERDAAQEELEAWRVREEEARHASAKLAGDLARVDALPGDDLDRLLSAGAPGVDSAPSP